MGSPDFQTRMCRPLWVTDRRGRDEGRLVTTSDFSKEARDYVNKVQHRIVLINGDRLARLMITSEIGVRARKSYVLRSVDEDYFSEY